MTPLSPAEEAALDVVLEVVETAARSELHEFMTDRVQGFLAGLAAVDPPLTVVGLDAERAARPTVEQGRHPWPSDYALERALDAARRQVADGALWHAVTTVREELKDRGYAIARLYADAQPAPGIDVERETKAVAFLLRATYHADYDMWAARMVECGFHGPTEAEAEAASERIRNALAAYESTEAEPEETT